jgi:hypothetical protein
MAHRCDDGAENKSATGLFADEMKIHFTAKRLDDAPFTRRDEKGGHLRRHFWRRIHEDYPSKFRIVRTIFFTSAEEG